MTFLSAQEWLPKSDIGTRERLIGAAVKLFQARSYADVSVNDILVATNLPKGSFYHHFSGGKEELACEAVAFIEAEVTNFLVGFIARTKEPKTLINVLSSAISAWLISTEFQQGALLGCLTATRPPPKLHQALKRATNAWVELVSKFWQDEQLATSKACLLLVTLDGAIQFARLHRDTSTLTETLNLLANVLDT